jgi:antitoxin PrlF
MDSTITAKGQTTIPKAAREHLGVKPGDRVKFFLHPDGSVVILPVLPVTVLRGMLKTDKHATIEEMNNAIEEGAVERYLRSGKP